MSDEHPPPLPDNADDYTEEECAEAPWGMAYEWEGDAR